MAHLRHTSVQQHPQRGTPLGLDIFMLDVTWLGLCVVSACFGVLLGVALANVIAPGNYWDCWGSLLIPWSLYNFWQQMPPQLQLPAALAACGVFVCYNLTRKTRYCD